MADKSFSIKARIEAEDRASSEVQKVEGRFQRFGNFLKSRFVITLGDVTRALRSVGRAFGAVISAAEEQEDAVTQLNAALAPLGENAAKVSKALQDNAAALQKVTKYGDETIIKGQALVASFTRNEEKIKQATKAALDFSAGMGVDLNAAFLLFARAAAGNTELLARYGIQLREGIRDADKFAETMKIVNDRWGGQAQAQAKTFRGVIGQIGNAWSDLLEVLGEVLTKDKDVMEGLKSLRDTISSPQFKQGLRDLISGFVEFIKAIKDAVSWIANLLGYLNKLGPLFGMATKDVKLFGDGIVYAADGAETASKSADRLNKSVDQVASTSEAAAASTNTLTKALQTQAEAQAELDRKTKEFEERVKGLGVTLESETNDAITKNNELLLEAEQRYLSGAISLADFEAIEKAVIRTNAQLSGSIDDITASLDSLNAATDNASSGFDDFANSGKDASESVSLLNGKLNETVSRLSLASSRIVTTAAAFDALAVSAGRSQAVVAALAGGARLSQGGTRINLPGGGSRLVSSPGIGGTSTINLGFGISGGTFTTITQRSLVQPNGRLLPYY